MELINLNRLSYFVAVVDTGSFTRAADRLGITKAVVSQQVMKLEDELRTALLVRTTRRVEPTEAGRMLHAKSVLILKEAQDAFSEIAMSKGEPSGLLRIAAPNDYGASVIAPLVAEFTHRYPSCQIDLVLSDARTDLIENKVDLSVRVGWLDDSSLQAQRLGSFRQMLVATPALAKRLDIAKPEDLASVPFIGNGALREPYVWAMSRDDFDRRVVRMRPGLLINSTPAVLSAAVAGGGVTVLPDFIVSLPLGTGELEAILPQWSLPAGGIHVVYPRSRYRAPKVTAFVAMLRDHLRRSLFAKA